MTEDRRDDNMSHKDWLDMMNKRRAAAPPEISPAQPPAGFAMTPAVRAALTGSTTGAIFMDAGRALLNEDGTLNLVVLNDGLVHVLQRLDLIAKALVQSSGATTASGLILPPGVRPPAPQGGDK